MSNFTALGPHDTAKKLPVHGDDDEITLSLNFPPDSPGRNVFRLNGKYLQLVHPLDRDKDNLSHIQFTVSVLIRSTISIYLFYLPKAPDKDFCFFASWICNADRFQLILCFFLSLSFFLTPNCRPLIFLCHSCFFFFFFRRFLAQLSQRQVEIEIFQ